MFFSVFCWNWNKISLYCSNFVIEKNGKVKHVSGQEMKYIVEISPCESFSQDATYIHFAFTVLSGWINGARKTTMKYPATAMKLKENDWNDSREGKCRNIIQSWKIKGLMFLTITGKLGWGSHQWRRSSAGVAAPFAGGVVAELAGCCSLYSPCWLVQAPGPGAERANPAWQAALHCPRQPEMGGTHRLYETAPLPFVVKTNWTS